MNRQIPTPLTETDIAAYERDGVIVLRNVIDAEWRDLLARVVERELIEPAPFSTTFGKGFVAGNQAWLKDKEMEDYVLHSPLPELAAILTRSSKVNLLCDQLFLKEPGTPNSPSPWHQDHVVFPTRGHNTISFWTSIDGATAESGTLKFIAGSHRWNRSFQPRRFTGEAIYPDVEGFEETPDFDGEQNRHRILSWDLAPGDMVAFHFSMVHSAGGNKSSTARRRAYTIRYCGDGVSYDPHPATHRMFKSLTMPAGGPLDCEMFPVVWRQGVAHAA